MPEKSKLPINKQASEMYGQFSKEETQPVSIFEKCSTALILREMQIKTTSIYHFTKA